LNSRPNIEYFSLLTTPATYPFYPIFFDLIAQILFHKECKTCYLLLFLFRPSYFPQRLTLEYLICPYLNIRDQILHPSDTAEKSLVLHALLFLHAHYKGEYKIFWTEW
jgi:hypothetical protein